MRDRASLSVPAITVIMPLRGSPAMLEASLASVRAQSWARWDMVVLDDGANPAGRALVEEMAQADARLSIVPAMAGEGDDLRNQGLAHARAPIIAFLEPGDLWAAGKLADHLALHARHPALAMSYDRIAFIAPDAGALVGARRLSRLRPRPLAALDMLGDDPACMICNVVMRREPVQALGGFDTTLSHAQDQDLLARLIGSGAQVEGIDAVLTGHRLRHTLAMAPAHMARGWREVILRHAEGREARRLEATQCRLIVLRVLQSGGRVWLAMPHVWRGLHLDSLAFLGGLRSGTALIVAFSMALALPPPWRRRLLA